MALGSLRRFAILGAGLLGLVGCKDYETTPIGRPPMAKGSTLPGMMPPGSQSAGIMNSSVKPNQTPPNAQYGNGVNPASYRQPITGLSSPGAGNLDMKPQYGSNPYNPNPYGSGNLTRPAVPGAVGPGAPMANVPSISPPEVSNYGSGSSPQPPGYNVPSAPPAPNSGGNLPLMPTR